MGNRFIVAIIVMSFGIAGVVVGAMERITPLIVLAAILIGVSHTLAYVAGYDAAIAIIRGERR